MKKTFHKDVQTSVQTAGWILQRGPARSARLSGQFSSWLSARIGLKVIDAKRETGRVAQGGANRENRADIIVVVNARFSGA